MSRLTELEEALRGGRKRGAEAADSPAEQLRTRPRTDEISMLGLLFQRMGVRDEDGVDGLTECLRRVAVHVDESGARGFEMRPRRTTDARGSGGEESGGWGYG